MAVINSQGSALYYASAATTASLITCPTDIQMSGGATDKIETTCLSDTHHKYGAGLQNSETITVQFNIHTADTSHQALVDLKESGAEKSWMIVGSENSTAPTASGSVMVAASGRSYMSFLGFVESLDISIGIGGIWKGTVVIQTNGGVTTDITP
jgi:hypothetical protein